MTIVYLNIAQVEAIHKKTVALSGGGADGVLDIGKLESVLTHIQNDDYYPDFADKLTHLLFAVCKFHCFEDGNKRMSLVLTLNMLMINGYLYCAKNFLREMENIVVWIAEDKMDKALLHQIICAILEDEFDSEEIKLAIIDAIGGIV